MTPGENDAQTEILSREECFLSSVTIQRPGSKVKPDTYTVQCGWLRSRGEAVLLKGGGGQGVPGLLSTLLMNDPPFTHLRNGDSNL